MTEQGNAKSTGQTSKLRQVIKAGSPPFMVVGAAILISLIEVGSTLAFPVITRNIIDSMGTNRFEMGSLFDNHLVYYLIVVLLIGTVAGALSSYLLSRSGLRVVRNLQSTLFSNIMAREVRFFDDQESGVLVSRVVNDTKSVSQLVTTGISGLTTGVMLLIGSIAVLYWLDAQLTGVIFAIILCTFVAMAPMIMRLAGITQKINKHISKSTALFSRVFSNIKLVKSFTGEDDEKEKMRANLHDIEIASRKLAKTQALLQPTNGLALTAAMIVLFTYGSARVHMGTLSPGTLTAFILFIFNIVAPLIHVSTFLSQLRSAQGASLALAELLEDSAEGLHQHQPTVPGFPVPNGGHGDLVFDSVVFSHRRNSEPLLQTGTLIIPQGSRTALVGPSGAGKSTLLYLIERFYAPDSGTITFGGIDIARIDLRAWRNCIGYVPQSAPLMRGSIRDNIAYGAPHVVDDAKVRQAAIAANCMEFINEFPDGLDTDVGESGMLLSGGQRQRIAIARMFYRDPSILLLDEATASLDGQSEATVMSAITRLMRGRTTIIVTHHLAAAGKVDQILTVEAGQVVVDSQSMRPVAGSVRAVATNVLGGGASL